MTATRTLSAVLILGLAGFLLYWLAPVLTPFLLGALLAYVFNPLVTRLQRWRVPRTLSVLLLFVLLAGAMALLLVWLVPHLQRAAEDFAMRLPGHLDALQGWAQPKFQTWFGNAAVIDLAALKQQLLDHWKEIGRAAGDVLAAITQSGMRIAGWIMNLVLVPIVTFYLLRDWNGIVARVPKLLPQSSRSRFVSLARETDAVLGAFLRGQLSVMLALAVVYTAGLWILGLHLALPIGLTAGLVSFVPYLGFIVGIAAAGIAVVFQFQDPWMLLGVLAVFGAGQMLEAMFLTPTLVGERIGLHPVAVIFAILAGGQLFGFFGVLLALPAAAVILVWARHLHGRLLSSTRAPRRRP